MIRENQTRKRFAILLFLSILPLMGCTEKSDDTLTPPAETESFSLPEAVPIANLEEITFSSLRATFPEPLLDEDFRALRALANSDIYLAFLSRVFKPTKPFQTFEEFLETTPLDARHQIQPILKQHFGHIAIDVQDIATFHKLITIEQSFLIFLKFHGRISLQPPPPHLQKALDRVHETKPFQRWFPPREIQPHRHQAFWKDFMAFAKNRTEATQKRTQELLHEHGQDNSLIWLAIQEPRILGIILNTFNDPLTAADFLHWVDPGRLRN